jgi:hypothetical protein
MWNLSSWGAENLRSGAAWGRGRPAPPNLQIKALSQPQIPLNHKSLSTTNPSQPQIQPAQHRSKHPSIQASKYPSIQASKKQSVKKTKQFVKRTKQFVKKPS